MKKDNKTEKLFHLTHVGIKIVVVILLVVYLSVYVINKTGIFLPFFAPVVFLIIFLLYDLLLVYFHKKGFYTLWQAAEFYKKCRERNISLFQEENIEKAKDVYFSIFGTDKYLGEGTLLSHMTEIYDSGRETTEKQ